MRCTEIFGLFESALYSTTLSHQTPACLNRQAAYLLAVWHWNKLSRCAGILLRWNSLSLGYTESEGDPVLREEIAKLYEIVTAQQITVMIPNEAIQIAARSFCPQLPKPSHLQSMTHLHTIDVAHHGKQD